MADKVKIWVMGTYKGPKENHWSIGGVFTSERQALAACVDKDDFIGPLNLNEVLPREDIHWVDGYYPLA